MAKQSTPLLSLTIKAGTTLINNRFVTATGANPSLNGNALGVVRQDAAVGDRVTVDVMGTTIVECGNNVYVGSAVSTMADGRVYSSYGVGKTVGIALSNANSGELTEILLVPNAS